MSLKVSKYRADVHGLLLSDKFSSEHRLFAAIIQRAANDFDYYMTLKPHYRNLRNYEDALDSYQFFNELGAYFNNTESPISFKNMLSIIFPTDYEHQAVLVKFKKKYETKPPTPEQSRENPEIFGEIDRTRYHNIIYNKRGNPRAYRPMIDRTTSKV